MNAARLAGSARRVGVPVVLIALITTSATLLGRIYDGPVLVWLMTGAGIGAVGVGMLARRLPNWQVAPLSVASMTGYLLVVGWWSARRAGLPGPVAPLLAEAAANGIPRLLTAMIPMEPVPDTVLVPVVAAWLAGFTATEIAVRAGRVLLGYLPPLLLFGAGVFVVGPNADPAGWPGLAFAVAAAIGLAVTGHPAPVVAAPTAHPAEHPVPAEAPRGPLARLRRRATMASLAGVIGVLVVVMLIAPVLLTRIATTSVDPRRYVTPPAVDSLDENPLTRISGWALNPDQPLFDVRVASEPSAPAAADPRPATTPGDRSLRLRLAVLHDYDGVTWRVGGTYRNAGRVLPPPASVTIDDDPAELSELSGDAVRQEVTIGELSGRLLPAAATAVRVDGLRVAYDADSGTLIHPDGLSPGLAYTVGSVPPRPALNTLTTADVPAGETVARTVRVADGVPADLRRLAGELARDNGAPYQRALAIEQFLADHYRLVADAPSGHAYPNLEFFLLGPRDAGGQRGTSEQFAAAYAVLGRLMGLPTRVVVGFVGPPGGGTVYGVDAVAWPEVLFAGIGWVAFDPLPRPDATPQPVEEEFRPLPDESTPPPTPAPLAAVEPDPTPAPEAATAPPSRRAPPGWLIGMTGGLVPLLGVAGWAVAVPALRRRLRRHRLTDGEPADRIAGAWLEVLDALRLAGHPAGPQLSATEVSRHADAVPAAGADPPSLDELSRLVNVSAFAPGQADEAQAARAGDLAAGYVTALRQGRSWWRRLVWSLRPGPLRWRRRTGRPARPTEPKLG
ncbi:transglutaminaseTgpA domain-containing protein [Solwaraspora sp. WMMD406]|uniref:transglutaminase family protein n=1 Tax=Solwaraspora sp. WMMD406 TaxID=3016095 RepID=UPI0024162686|nr:transglutaminase domain-containing protein [Solwaraspora sp. WMMD406]MDG4765690.1 transglutaminaseTgpA domain-containing protein [Solwaraspora sp. WMMD406]